MGKTMKKKLSTIMLIGFIVITLLMTSCYSQQPDELSAGLDKMQEGVTSDPLYLGKEQLIRFNEHTGAHIYLTEYEITADGFYHITGNIDFVVLQYDRKTAQEDIYVVLRTQFTLTYQKEDGLRKIVDYQVQSLPGSIYVEIWEQSSQSDAQAQDLLSLEEPQTATMYVNLSDVQWGIPAIFTWQCEMMLDKNENVVLSLKPLAEETEK